MSLLSRLDVFSRLATTSPIVKQTPIVAFFAVAFGLTAFVPDLAPATWSIVWAGVLGIVLSTVLAVVCTVSASLSHLAILVPCIDFLALGIYRFGIGESASLFSAIIVLPVVWLASEEGRAYILLAALGTSVALMIPNIIEGRLPATPSEWLRGIFTPLVFAAAAAIVNQIANQSRQQLASIQSLAEEREIMLRGAVDYTDRLRENEEALRAADRLTRSVLDAVTEQSVIGSDVTGLIDVWNPGAERMLGLTARETQGKRYVHEFHVEAELLQRSKELNYPPGETVLNPGFSALVESARLGKPEVRNWTYVRADGSTISVEVAVTRRVDETGATTGYLYVATDITQALEVSRLKDEFVGLISHELRTPLSSILGYLELMRDDDENPISEEQLQYLGVAERNAHRLLRLVGDLLFTAQVGSSSFTLETHEVDVAPIVVASVESARLGASAAGVELSVAVTGDSLLPGDAQRLGQACDNLISNAIKFTPRGGRVAVTVEGTADRVVIRVSDSGMGIPEAELDQLFARFFRASTATRNAVPGVGLGLSITKAIVVAHAGELDVESEVGVGTTFIMRLPR
ncbi:ATP-binding protein [Galbitalea sp. SE-J8]|uniref:ATP-binding protein n=1 Tax=Galbitalea sp. SE-J8 TaxID=3054952 RepID=UPI00259CF11D|nr:ATP-binding protein [Galbitalea sp. SE-J8]MDM4763537.1 ATP-binding protein [Galbitalea sp. SE-J8]